MDRRRRDRDRRAAGRRRPDGAGGARRRSSALADLVDLPGADADEEADVEGLARDGALPVGGRLAQPAPQADQGPHEGPKALERLARVEGQANRQILVRLPIAEVDGLPTPVRRSRSTGSGTGPRRSAAAHDLRDLLRDDEHLAPFLPIPGKDNGLDIEGIAVRGDRVYLGLRGPVLRGWAFVLELRPYVDEDDPDRLRLRRVRRRPAATASTSSTSTGSACATCARHGDDLLVLAGPTMDLDGPVRVYRWHGAMPVDVPTIVRGDADHPRAGADRTARATTTPRASACSATDRGCSSSTTARRPSACRTAR